MLTLMHQACRVTSRGSAVPPLLVISFAGRRLLGGMACGMWDVMPEGVGMYGGSR